MSLANITEVKPSGSSSKFSFKMFFKGKEESMKLVAPSKVREYNLN